MRAFIGLVMFGVGFWCLLGSGPMPDNQLRASCAIAWFTAARVAFMEG